MRRSLLVLALFISVLLAGCGAGGPSIGGGDLAPVDAPSVSNTTVGDSDVREVDVDPELVENEVGTRAPSAGSLSGLVQSSSGAVLKNALVETSVSQKAYTGSDGRFRFASVPAGSVSVRVSLSGYRTAQGTVTVRSGQTTNVLITLSPTTPPPAQTGTLNVAGYAFYSGSTRYYVYRIEVQEYGNYSKRWSNTWYYDNGWSRADLACTSANIGKSHTIKITWRNAYGTQYANTWYRTLTRSGQTETFYNP